MTVGIREVEIVRDVLKSDDGEGRGFMFRVNGIDVFIKGANLVPIDAFHAQVNR